LNSNSLIEFQITIWKQFQNRHNFKISTSVQLLNVLRKLTPVDLYLISEKSNWKNQVPQTGFLVYFKLDFYCLCSQINFLQAKKPVRRTWFFQIAFSKIKLQINRGRVKQQDKGLFLLWDLLTTGGTNSFIIS